MSILDESKFKGKREIDLTGQEGNAYFLLGTAMNLAKQLEYDEPKKEQLLDDMKSGDYENLLNVFDNHFGEVVDLVR